MMLSLSSNDDAIKFDLFVSWFKFQYHNQISKNDLILIMTPEKQNKTWVEQTLVSRLNTSKKWSDNENDISSKSVKCDKICSNY